MSIEIRLIRVFRIIDNSNVVTFVEVRLLCFLCVVFSVVTHDAVAGSLVGHFFDQVDIVVTDGVISVVDVIVLVPLFVFVNPILYDASRSFRPIVIVESLINKPDADSQKGKQE